MNRWQCPRGHNETTHDESAKFCSECGAPLERPVPPEFAEDEQRYALEAADEGVWALEGDA